MLNQARAAVQGLSGWRLGSELRLAARRVRPDPGRQPAPLPRAPRAPRSARPNLVLVPCQPNALDVWASAPTLGAGAGGGHRRAHGARPRAAARPRRRAECVDEIAAQRWPHGRRRLLGNRAGVRGLDRRGPRGPPSPAPRSAAAPGDRRARATRCSPASPEVPARRRPRHQRRQDRRGARPMDHRSGSDLGQPGPAPSSAVFIDVPAASRAPRPLAVLRGRRHRRPADRLDYTLPVYALRRDGVAATDQSCAAAPSNGTNSRPCQMYQT